MNTYLLDVNMLLALGWPNHLHHQRAHDWMAGVPARRWATCPFTEAAFVRLSCNAGVVGTTVFPKQALDILEANTGLTEHVFWTDELPLATALAPVADRIIGNRQITSAYLLGLAISNKGVLATLDQGVGDLLGADSPHQSALEMIGV